MQVDNTNNTVTISKKNGIWMALIGIAVPLVTVILSFVIDFRKEDREYNRMLKELIIQQRELDIPEEVKAQRDSLKQIEYANVQAKALEDAIEIEKSLQSFSSVIPEHNHVTIYSIHDHGGEINTAEQQYLTAIYSNNEQVKKDWQKRELPIGYKWMAVKSIQNKISYIPDLKSSDDVYIGEAKDYSSYIGSQSLLTCYIKGEYGYMYFFSVSFKNKSPMEEDPFLRIKVLNFKNRLANLINSASVEITKNH